MVVVVISAIPCHLLISFCSFLTCDGCCIIKKSSTGGPLYTWPFGCMDVKYEEA